MVAKEIKPVDMQLGGADTFSSTPPIEAVYTLLSAFMSKDPKKGNVKLANWDISHAHFMGRAAAARDIFMELPEQDMVRPGNQWSQSSCGACTGPRMRVKSFRKMIKSG